MNFRSDTNIFGDEMEISRTFVIRCSILICEWVVVVMVWVWVLGACSILSLLLLAKHIFGTIIEIRDEMKTVKANNVYTAWARILSDPKWVYSMRKDSVDVD